MPAPDFTTVEALNEIVLILEAQESFDYGSLTSLNELLTGLVFGLGCVFGFFFMSVSCYFLLWGFKR